MRLHKGIAVAAFALVTPTLALALQNTPRETLRVRPSATAIEVLGNRDAERFERERDKEARKAAKEAEKRERKRAKELRKEQRELEKDLREAEREHAKDLQEAERERRKQQ